jgi:hypothetical protein
MPEGTRIEPLAHPPSPPSQEVKAFMKEALKPLDGSSGSNVPSRDTTNFSQGAQLFNAAADAEEKTVSHDTPAAAVAAHAAVPQRSEKQMKVSTLWTHEPRTTAPGRWFGMLRAVLTIASVYANSSF